jgi:anthranilate phosphoribosyltransferase
MSNPTTSADGAGLDEHGGWPGVLGTLADGRDLSGDAAAAVLGTILAGEATDAQIAAFIVGLRIKGETVDELAGLQQAMLGAASPLSVPAGTIDIVGVGGAPSRRTGALNVSTMAAFVAAGAGATVCKHGNRKASSTSGSFDLLEALGVAVDIDPPTLERQVADIGVGFAFARTFHPAMRHVGPVRAELGIPTVFNILGPLSHPGRLTRQVIGAADWSIADRMARVLRATGSERVLVVHGDGGLDELSTTGPSKMISVDGDDIREVAVDAVDLGLARATAADLVGGDAEANAAIARRIFAGAPGPHRDIVVLNAAAGIVVAGLADDLADGVARAEAAIDDGRAAAKLEALAAV